MIKRTISGKEAKEKLMEGAKMLYTPVASTLGPKGKNVIISPFHGMARTTKDGVTVAGEIESDNPFINAAIKMLRQVAMKTVEIAGDGTTTATVLAYNLLLAIEERVKAGHDILEIKKEIQEDLLKCVEIIENSASSLISEVGELNIEKLKQIATTSANNDEGIGQLFADAYGVIGADGTVILQETEKAETYLEASSGMKQGRGYDNPNFATSPEKCEYSNPVFFVTDKYLTSQKDLQKIIEYTHSSNLALIIVCLDIAGEAKAFLNSNRQQTKDFRVSVVTFPQWFPNYRDILEDIAIYTRATFCTETNGYNLDNITPEEIPAMLGSAKSFTSTPKDCLFIEGNGTIGGIMNRIAAIKAKITPEIAPSEQEALFERASKLSGGVAVLYAGGTTIAERKETADRCDDAIKAVRSALEEGYLPGGGLTYLHCAIALNKSRKFSILDGVLCSIFYKICENANIDSEKKLKEFSGILAKNKNKNSIGYNAKTDKIEDLIESGVIDSAKVVRVALENAVSVALMFLTTDCLIAEFKD